MSFVTPGYWEPGYTVDDGAEVTPSPIRQPTPPRLLLWEQLPLRTTRMLGDYAEDLPLPVGFGDLSAAPFPLIRLSATRYFGFDHVWQVTQVFADKQLVRDWDSVLASDGARSWTEVHFAAPVPQGTAVSATGKGKRNADTGVLLENVADIAEFISHEAGRDDDFSQLRAESSALDIRVAGRISELKAVKDHIDEAMQSVGAIWSTLNMARLYPAAGDPQLVIDLDKSEVDGIEVTASVVDTADVLRLSYDRSDASGKALHYIELSASPRRYGGLSKEIVYPLLRTPANAEAIGRPVLQRLAGERYEVKFDSTRRSLRPGMYVRPVDHPDWPLDSDDPVIMILQVVPQPETNDVHVTGETLIGDKSIVTVTAHSIALADTVQAGLDVSVRDGVATFTATDEDGRPLAGARVSLDGGEAKTTDMQGHVSFTIAVGAEGVLHEIAFEAPGFTPVKMEIPL